MNNPIGHGFNSERRGKGGLCENHYLAKSGVLISPSNIAYPFRNLRHFIRGHNQLFLQKDLIMKSFISMNLSSCRGTKRCNAETRLYEVLTGRKTSWKGWRATYKGSLSTGDMTDDL